MPRCVLLRSVRGLELVEHEGADECCGFGGTFAVVFSKRKRLCRGSTLTWKYESR